MSNEALLSILVCNESFVQKKGDCYCRPRNRFRTAMFSYISSVLHLEAYIHSEKYMVLIATKGCYIALVILEWTSSLHQFGCGQRIQESDLFNSDFISKCNISYPYFKSMD